MITDDYSPQEILGHIDPSGCSYNDWLAVGMALKKAGEPCSTWSEWSSYDRARYHPGECEAKWLSFHGAALRDVSMGTVVQMALNSGWKPDAEPVRAYDWNETITLVDPDDIYPYFLGSRKNDGRIIDASWIQEEEVPPLNPNIGPDMQMCQYIEALFQPDEYVCIVTDAHKHDQEDGTVKYTPMRGIIRKAQEWIDQITSAHGDLSPVMGTLRDEFGAWVRFNPLDGQDVTDKNVTSYRYALVECDDLPIGKQYALIKELRLPVKALVHSGGKSLHAICHINARTFNEYRERVEFLYSTCERNGLKLDRSNKNPSRLSRLPGCLRNGRPQYIIDMDIGCVDWESWCDYIASINDELPDIVNLKDVYYDMKPLAPELIHGVLRKGHKMLLSGPSKAGKSFALIELCVAIAEGGSWFGFQCEQGRVLYLNLELDEASCFHRFHDVYESLGLSGNSIGYIDIWNLRGEAEPLDKLTPKIIRHCKEVQYEAVIIDPIYKVLTGDENAAAEMALFCNQFDRISKQMGCSVIYCHHHSKGNQWGKKAADRSSGSGVFARDPDAMIDLVEIELTDDDRDAIYEENRVTLARDAMKAMWPDWMSEFSGVDVSSSSQILHRMGELDTEKRDYVASVIESKIGSYEEWTLWHIEGVLREFPSFRPFDLWFRYPLHMRKTESYMPGKKPDKPKEKGPAWGSEEARQKGLDAMQAGQDQKRFSNEILLGEAVAACGGVFSEIVEYTGKSDDTIRRWLKQFGYAKSADGTYFLPDSVPQNLPQS